MNFHRLKYILVITTLAMILHTVEEYVTKLWNHDSFIIAFAQWSNINPIVVYLGIQFLALLVISATLFLALKKVFVKSLGILLGLIFLLELLHPYNSIRIMEYYSGLFTGIILVIVGCFYWKELIELLIKERS